MQSSQRCVILRLRGIEKPSKHSRYLLRLAFMTRGCAGGLGYGGWIGSRECFLETLLQRTLQALPLRFALLDISCLTLRLGCHCRFSCEFRVSRREASERCNHFVIGDLAEIGI